MQHVRFRRVRTALAVAMVGAGLAAIPSVSGAGQNGVNNYAGPLTCAQATIKYGVIFDSCTSDTTVTQQSSSGAGLNVFEAAGTGGTATQTNQSGNNLAVCVLAPATTTGPNTSTNHSCGITQTSSTGNNSVIADVQVAHSYTDVIGTGATSQDARVALTAAQTSTSGDNSVKGNGAAPARLRITQSLTSNLNANIPANQTQESLMVADLKQTATAGDNVIDLDLGRTQTAAASAASPTQRQDVRDNAATDPNGRALVEQQTNTGTNSYKARADDTKSATSTVLDNGLLGGLRQTQGHTGGGWLMQTRQDSPGNPQGSTVDLGTPPAGADPNCATPGVVKKWTLAASAPLGGTYNGPATRLQDDKLAIPVIGKSPWTVTSYECSSLKAPPGTRQIASITADGHTKSRWTGTQAATLVSDQTIAGRNDFSAQDVHESLDCSQNAPNTCSEAGGGVTGSGTDVSATEGTPFTGTVASFTDSDPAGTAESYSAEIDWGDGSDPSAGTINASGTGFTIDGTHTYADEGTYAVSTTLRSAADGTEAGFYTSTATVANLPVTVVARDDLFANATSFSGIVGTFTDANPSSDPSDFRATINWGDGHTTDPATITRFGGVYKVSGTHNINTPTGGPITTVVSVFENGALVGSDTGTVNTFKYLPKGAFVLGNKAGQFGDARVGSNVTFYGSTWSPKNPMWGGSAPSGFKGYASEPTTPPCGVYWKITVGNSAPAASVVPAGMYVATIVTKKVSSITGGYKGEIERIVIVKTNAGYAPNATGTGTIVREICRSTYHGGDDDD